MYKILLYIIEYIISYKNITFLLNTKKNIWKFLIGFFLFQLAILIPKNFTSLYILLVLIFQFYLISKNFNKTINAVTYHYLSILIIDITYSFLTLTLKISILTNPLIANILISTLSYILIRRKIMLDLWNILKDKNDILKVFLITIITIYIQIKIHSNKFNCLLMISIILLLIYSIIKLKIQEYELEKEYDKIIKNIEIYEHQLQELRIRSHEQQNILRCIRSMKSNKEIIKFIDSILEEKNTKDYTILKEVLKIKINYIKGLLYEKLILCKEKNINFILNISSNINYKKTDNLDQNTLRDMTIILGILLDNAIEACNKTIQKSLSIYLYEEQNNLVIQISNTFKGTINIDLLYKPGYSTKGKNHGFGLSLLKSKIQANKNITIKSEISSDVFIQYLKIKLNNKNHS